MLYYIYYPAYVVMHMLSGVCCRMFSYEVGLLILPCVCYFVLSMFLRMLSCISEYVVLHMITICHSCPAYVVRHIFSVYVIMHMLSCICCLAYDYSMLSYFVVLLILSSIFGPAYVVMNMLSCVYCTAYIVMRILSCVCYHTYVVLRLLPCVLSEYVVLRMISVFCPACDHSMLFCLYCLAYFVLCMLSCVYFPAYVVLRISSYVIRVCCPACVLGVYIPDIFHEVLLEVDDLLDQLAVIFLQLGDGLLVLLLLQASLLRQLVPGLILGYVDTWKNGIK